MRGIGYDVLHETEKHERLSHVAYAIDTVTPYAMDPLRWHLMSEGAGRVARFFTVHAPPYSTMWTPLS